MSKANGSFENVIVTSDEPWSNIWHTQLHYAYQLSKRFNVIYVDPPRPWKVKNLIDFKPDVKVISKSLKVVRYKNFIPLFLGRFSVIVNDFINEILLKKMIPGLKRNSKLVIWHFDHFRSHFIFRKYPKSKHIYHVVDPAFGYHMDNEMAAAADLVVVTSPKFLSNYKELNANTIQVGQGVDIDFFKKEFTDDSLRSLVSFDSILLLGTFSDQIDYTFLHLLAERYPGKLVLIGPDKTFAAETKEALQQLKSKPGVNWLGPMDPSEFHKHLIACRVGIISYTYSNFERNNLRSPLKVISYLACGKCIISNIDCEVPSLTGKAIYIVNNYETYFNLLDDSFNNKLLFDQEAVNMFLDSINYDKLLLHIFSTMEEQMPNVE